jgi:sulfite exporter TauE/SafE
MTFLPAFIIGLAGSLHCIGMCSPLVMAISGSGRNAIVRNLQYNFGRLVTYGILGCIISLAGKGLHFTGLQQVISIAFGVALLIIAITNTAIAIPAFLRTPITNISITLKNLFARVLRQNTHGVLMLGMINGLLPCGMTLIALAYCVTLPSSTDGLLAMLCFGLGTLPGMVGFAATTKYVVSILGVRFGKLRSALIIGCAVILIGRAVWTGDHVSDHSIQSTASEDVVVCGDPQTL